MQQKKHLLRDAHLVQQFNCQPQFQYGNPPDSIPLWVAAREDNTLSSRLTRPSHFPSVSFYYFTYIGIWPGSYQDYQIKKTPFQVSLLFGSFLSSQAASSQVLSAFVSLTSVFGMGTGVSSQLLPPYLKVVPSKLYRSITEALCFGRVVKS